MSTPLKNEYAVYHTELPSLPGYKKLKNTFLQKSDKNEAIDQEITEVKEEIKRFEKLYEDNLQNIQKYINLLPEKGVAVYTSRNQPRYEGVLTSEERDLDNTFIYLKDYISNICIVCQRQGNMNEKLKYLEKAKQ